MAITDGLTKARMLAIEAASIVAARLSSGHLILTKHDGTDIDVGNVKGDVGPVPINNELPVGSPVPWLTSTPPSGWLLLNGSVYSPTDCPVLFARWGTTFGGTAGAPLLPDMRKKGFFGVDAATSQLDTVGKVGGEVAHALTVGELAVHTHVQDPHNHTQNSHNHTQDPHNHTQNSHNHTQDAHNHTQNPHNHSDAGHSHTASSAGETQEHTHGPGSLTGSYDMRSVDDSGTTYHGAIQYIFSGFDRSSEGGTVHITGGTTGGRSAVHNHAITVDGAYSGLAAATATNNAATATNQAATATNQAATATNQAATAVNQAATATNQNAGSGTAHNNMPPFMACNWIVRAA